MVANIHRQNKRNGSNSEHSKRFAMKYEEQTQQTLNCQRYIFLVCSICHCVLNVLNKLSKNRNTDAEKCYFALLRRMWFNKHRAPTYTHHPMTLWSEFREYILCRFSLSLYSFRVLLYFLWKSSGKSISFFFSCCFRSIFFLFRFLFFISVIISILTCHHSHTDGLVFMSFWQFPIFLLSSHW